MQQIFGVDIGNSGIRVTELLLASRQLGPMLRIDWWPDERESPQLKTAARRFRPDDPRWLSELDGFVKQRERPLCAAGVVEPARWLISSVRRDALHLLLDYLDAGTLDAGTLDAGSRLHCTRQVEVVTHRTLPLEVQVDVPQAVGIDRLLAALAALEFMEASFAVVIQAGSAVTVDLIQQSSSQAQAAAGAPPVTQLQSGMQTLGTFAGGAILPGVPMMLRLLGKGADQLPQITAAELLGLPELPGKNTEAAMICGTASALVGGVSHLVGRYREKFGQSIPVIISGGDGMRLSPYLAAPLIVRDHLVHRGLMRIAEL